MIARWIDREATARFWAYVGEHRDALAAVDGADVPILDALLVELRRVHPGLRFELSTRSRPRELVITVGGREDLFDVADAVVAAAPALSGWTIRALKEGVGFDFTTVYEGVPFDPAELAFQGLRRASRPADLGLRIAVPGLEDEQRALALAAVHVILDTGLGERLYARGVQHVEVVASPPRPERAGFRPLSELPDYVRRHLAGHS